MQYYLFKLTLDYIFLLFWKLLLFEFLLCISENFLCTMSAFPVKIAPLLDVLQLLMFFVPTLTYLVSNMLVLIIFYNVTFLIIKILIAFKMNVFMCMYIYIYFFSHSLMVGVIEPIELLLSK
jgi:hypothetical protein